MGRSIWVVAVGVALAWSIMPPVFAEEPAAAGKVTDPFRTEHETLRGHLQHMTALVGDLGSQEADKQKETMNHVVMCMTDNIVAHAKWEEEVLYPLVDKHAGMAAAPNTFTASMRHEHKIVGRWILELKNEAAKPEPDIRAFVRRADNVLGLVTAHFEEEEDVLLPILDAKMTAEEFKRDVTDKMESHAH